MLQAHRSRHPGNARSAELRRSAGLDVLLEPLRCRCGLPMGWPMKDQSERFGGGTRKRRTFSFRGEACAETRFVWSRLRFSLHRDRGFHRSASVVTRRRGSRGIASAFPLARLAAGCRAIAATVASLPGVVLHRAGASRPCRAPLQDAAPRLRLQVSRQRQSGRLGVPTPAGVFHHIPKPYMTGSSGHARANSRHEQALGLFLRTARATLRTSWPGGINPGGKVACKRLASVMRWNASPAAHPVTLSRVAASTQESEAT